MASVPELDASEDTGGVVDDRHVVRELAGVEAPAFPPPSQQRSKNIRSRRMSIAFITRLAQRSSPISLRAALAELLVVRLALAERGVGELQVREQMPVVEACPCRTRCRGLCASSKPWPGDHRSALQVGVVRHLGLLPELAATGRRRGGSPST